MKHENLKGFGFQVCEQCKTPEACADYGGCYIACFKKEIFDKEIKNWFDERGIMPLDIGNYESNEPIN